MPPVMLLTHRLISDQIPKHGLCLRSCSVQESVSCYRIDCCISIFCHTADQPLISVLYTCHHASRQKSHDSSRDVSIEFSFANTFTPTLAHASELNARLTPNGIVYFTTNALMRSTSHHDSFQIITNDTF